MCHVDIRGANMIMYSAANSWVCTVQALKGSTFFADVSDLLRQSLGRYPRRYRRSGT